MPVPRGLHHIPLIKGLHLVYSQKLKDPDNVCQELFPWAQLILVKQINCKHLEKIETKLEQNLRECVLEQSQGDRASVGCDCLTFVGTSEPFLRAPST
jgi:hypothetical protein